MRTQKLFFWNYGFYSIIRNNLSEKSSHAKNCLFSALNSWEFKLFHTKLSYLVLAPKVRNRHIKCSYVKLVEHQKCGFFLLIFFLVYVWHMSSQSSCQELLKPYKFEQIIDKMEKNSGNQVSLFVCVCDRVKVLKQRWRWLFVCLFLKQ